MPLFPLPLSLQLAFQKNVHIIIHCVDILVEIINVWEQRHSKNNTPNKNTLFQFVIHIQYKHLYMWHFLVFHWFSLFFSVIILKVGKTEQG